VAQSLVAEPSFHPPRLKFELDIEAILAAAPATATARGRYLTRTLDMRPEGLSEEEVLHQAGIPFKRFVPFQAYPWTEFFRLACAVASLLDEDSVSAGLRTVGRSYYPDFANSVTGKIVFGLLGRNIEKVIPLAPTAWSLSGTFGKIHAQPLGSRHYRYHFEDYPSPVAESLFAGILEGLITHCNSSGTIGFVGVGEMESMFDIRW